MEILKRKGNFQPTRHDKVSAWDKQDKKTRVLRRAGEDRSKAVEKKRNLANLQKKRYKGEHHQKLPLLEFMTPVCDVTLMRKVTLKMNCEEMEVKQQQG